MFNKGNIYACYNGTCNAIMRFQMQQADVKRFVIQYIRGRVAIVTFLTISAMTETDDSVVTDHHGVHGFGQSLTYDSKVPVDTSMREV